MRTAVRVAPGNRSQATCPVGLPVSDGVARRDQTVPVQDWGGGWLVVVVGASRGPRPSSCLWVHAAGVPGFAPLVVRVRPI